MMTTPQVPVWVVRAAEEIVELTLEDEEQRHAAAYHEAAHVVVGMAKGWWVGPKGVWIDEYGLGYAGMQLRIGDNIIHDRMLQSMAGRAAEQRWHGECVFGSDSDWLYALEEALETIECWPDPDDDPDDRTHEVIMLIEKYGELVRKPAALTRLARAYWRDTQRMLNEPEIWADIERVAKALLASGKLTGDQVHEALAA
jgi:hypothetical protein